MIIQLDDDGYVIGYADHLDDGATLAGAVEVEELPDDYAHYRYIDGQLQRDTARIDKEAAKAIGLQMLRQLQTQVQTQAILASATDEQAYVMRYLYDAYEVGKAYKAGDRFIHNGKFYKVEQAHTSAAQWPPESSPSLYTEIADPAEEWPEWVQPTHAGNAYAIGDKVTHYGKRYISQIAANTTEPGSDARWWKEVN